MWLRWSKELNIIEFSAAQYTYPDNIPLYKLQPQYFVFDIDNPISKVTKYNLEISQPEKKDVLLHGFEGTITNIKVFDVYHDSISEILQMFPTHQHLMINDTARKVLDMHGSSMHKYILIINMKHILKFKNIDEYTTVKDNDMLAIPNVSFIDLDNKVVYLKVNKCPNCYIKFEDPNILQYILESLGLPADSEGVTYKQASEYTGNLDLSDKNDLTSFNELVEFTSITELDNFLNSCSSLVSVDLSNIVSINNMSFFQCENLKDLGDTSKVETISDSFNVCTSLTSISFPNVTTIGSNTFMNCISLTSINLPKVTTIRAEAFSRCENLTSLDLPNITTIGENAFGDCYGLISLNLPNVMTIEENSFNGCNNLESINMLNIENIPNYFISSNTNLTSLKLPKATTIGQEAFKSCENLTSLDLPNVTTIGEYAFCDCYGLTSINLPKVKTIGQYAFNNCSNLTSLDLPNVITIEDQAFNMCTLTSINLPNAVTIKGGFSINVNILDLPKIEYMDISSIYCDVLIIRTENKVCENINYDNIYGHGYISYDDPNYPTIYVPDNLVDSYKADANWSTYADYIKPLSEYV